MVSLSSTFSKLVLRQGKKATVAYEITVNHSGRCLHISVGHPDSRNDETIVKTDQLVMDLKNNKILQDVEYKLFKVSLSYLQRCNLDKRVISPLNYNALFLLKADGTESIVRGPYLITDNGYAKWRIIQCPIKFCTDESELRWSSRLESVRKDVECYFGRLKARFRILQSNTLFHHQHKVDNVFIASSILHNMNLVHDGLDIAWKNPAN